MRKIVTKTSRIIRPICDSGPVRFETFARRRRREQQKCGKNVSNKLITNKLGNNEEKFHTKSIFLHLIHSDV